MFGKFPCTRCKRRFPYKQIVGTHHYICLDCYAWAKGVHERNAQKPASTHPMDFEVDILLGYSAWTPWGYQRMLTFAEADLALASRPQRCPIIFQGERAGAHAHCLFCGERVSSGYNHYCSEAIPETKR